MRKLLLIFLMTGTVWAQTLTSINIIPPSTGFYAPTVGSTVQPTALCTFSDGSTNNCSTVSLTWRSNDDGILTVDPVTGFTTNTSTNVDSAFAEVVAYSGHIVDHRNIAFTPLDATQIVWQPTGFNTIVTGTTVVVSPAINSGGVGGFCAWTSSNPAVLTVNLNGETVGVSPGTADLTCTIGTAHSTATYTVATPTQTLTTWYAGRANGGDRTQCTGLVDADYSGSGSAQPCAFSNPMWLFTDNTGGNPQSSYTGVVQSGDTAIIHDIGQQPAGTPDAWPMNCFTLNNGCWNTFGNFGAIIFPSGTPPHHTKILGANFASCTKNTDSTDNRTHLWGQLTSQVFNANGAQNVDFACLDIGSYTDCQNAQLGPEYAFMCPVPPAYAITVNDFSASVNLTDMKIHGFQNSLTGMPGPGLVFTDYRAIDNWAEGLNYAEFFGATGQSADGFEGHYFEALASGYTEEQPKLLSSVVRDGSGNLAVTFAPGAAVNYIVGNNITLKKMTPSDLNGTYPVTAITFNQQNLSITGGNCVLNGADGNNGIYYCTFNTSTTPAFGQGAFVQISGTSVSGGTATSLNGTFEVFSADASSFTINASPISRLGWGTGTIASGGTAATANTLTATAAGSSETATVLGEAGHVNSRHHGMDQGSCAACNGDGFGAGDATGGVDLCDHCTFGDNLQDGDDNLHGGLRSSTFTNSLVFGNEGAGVKVGNADVLLYSNVVAIGNCGVQLAFNRDNPPDASQYLALPCRAGAIIGTGTRAWTIANLTNISTMTGFTDFISNNCSDTMDGTGCTALPTVAEFTIQNNNFYGYIDPAAGSNIPGIYFNGLNTSPAWTYLNNNGFHTNGVPWSGGGNVEVDPLIVTPIANVTPPGPVGEAGTLNWNMNLTSSSPMIGAGIKNTVTPTLDFSGKTRPNPPSIGAYEFQGIATPTGFSGNVTIKGNVVIR